jgi:hypothetical protein
MEMGEGELERDGEAETEITARCSEWMGCKERKPNLGHGTIDAIDGYRYGLPVGGDFFDAQCSAGRILSMGYGVGCQLEATLGKQ